MEGRIHQPGRKTGGDAGGSPLPSARPPLTAPSEAFPGARPMRIDIKDRTDDYYLRRQPLNRGCPNRSAIHDPGTPPRWRQRMVPVEMVSVRSTTVVRPQPIPTSIVHPADEAAQ
jgi:hypothetical protein